MKKNIRLITILTLICIFCTGMLSGVYAYPDMPSEGYTVDTYNLDPAHPESSFVFKNFQTPQAYNDNLSRKMKDVYEELSPKISNEKTMPIPGLVFTIAGSDEGAVASERFIPQGVCNAGYYRLVTAYDENKKLNSVIYVIDRNTLELVSTISVPNRYHVGGIAFDGENVWLPGNTSHAYDGKPFVQYIKFEDLKRMAQHKNYKMSKEEISKRVYIKNVPSFLTCADGRLWVGTYVGAKQSKEGYAYGYQIMDDGEKVKLNTVVYKVITGIDSSAQGMDFDGDMMYISSSYKGNVASVKSSFVTKYDVSLLKSKRNNLDVKKKEISRIEVPKMSEELIVDGDTICINFEAGASRWRFAVVKTDRLLSVDKRLWGKD